ncbi:P-loop containing nucleoside triphosphate hydrolase protein [Coniophora puteana RWD-64-598 SS2]|uniref:p-loop containing nucleoside triphosphate hydrolase protein n=1 Tax=Coniophora puteana (strain RWD-64-598) TaxID=741705 RepID=R7SET1_CONPW|nr:P-loop containing nucleoside triphosphate hydrolase protein [Coniophora puteana RWD-64-598 SS2]EIW74375.1 P-loop containing nucleoside triphosphate hydrolase protein [Coniophora puteana RWD-64-598 SS2]
MLGHRSSAGPDSAQSGFEIVDLPVLPLSMRASYLYTRMRRAVTTTTTKPGSGWSLGWRLVRVNVGAVVVLLVLTAVSAVLRYMPALFVEHIVGYLESDPERKDRRLGWTYALGLAVATYAHVIVSNQVMFFSSSILQSRLRLELNTILFHKTLTRKDLASYGAASGPSGSDSEEQGEELASKAEVMTLMTSDADRIGECARSINTLVDVPIQIVVGTLLLYKLLGVSSLIGLVCAFAFLPLNQLSSGIVMRAQKTLMKSRSERVSLMNEILGAIRMLKFMAWERSYEHKVLKVRERELKAQKLTYMIEVCLSVILDGSPIVATLVAFWHFAFVRQQTLAPSIAFASILVFNEMKIALYLLPNLFVGLLQAFVSLCRIERYLAGTEVPLPDSASQPEQISLCNASITWPRGRGAIDSRRSQFTLTDLSFELPPGELSLICGKLGSGKTLLLLGLLGEADVVAGQVLCPRSTPNALASMSHGLPIEREEWVVKGVCAYVPQVAWLRNASIKDNILFNLPFDEERYQKTLEVCALTADLQILEDGDESEIGEKGINLSGGQKARVSLARAVYSRASVVLLDDVLSAVDAHTAYHLYNQCLKGELMQGRTIVLVSHNVQLASSGASYVVALDNGRVAFRGDTNAFRSSSIMSQLAHAEILDESETASDDKEDQPMDTGAQGKITDTSKVKPEQGHIKTPRKLVQDEKRAQGRLGRNIWGIYMTACGGSFYWAVFFLVFICAALIPVAENWWLKTWSGSSEGAIEEKGVIYYLKVYAAITLAGLVFRVVPDYVVFTGGITASTKLYKRMLESVLLANIRFHDTASRGVLLNRFAKDFEVLDSVLPGDFGRIFLFGLASLTTIVVVITVGGWVFLIAACLVGYMYWQVAKLYGKTAQDIRRLDSVARSSLYSIYGETIAGVTVIRAFGASSKFLRDMMRCADTNANPFFWTWGVNRWLSSRFYLLAGTMVALTGFAAVLSPQISAPLAGFSLAFAAGISSNLYFFVRMYTAVEQSLVALERVDELSNIEPESPEILEYRPCASWPDRGSVVCEDLAIRYAHDLPNVLHRLNFEVKPGEKIGILGRTGSGKSTLALSLFRFVEATEGRIVIDGVDISKIGLTDLRSRLTIIPQDPTILSGTLRSTLDVFGEYDDADIYEALKRVHLIPSVHQSEAETDDLEAINANAFRNLDSLVSEGGDNFSAGEKQLICMARAILKHSRVLVMDEATASVDYATDELISKTIREEFSSSTILTIAHRLRTVIDYDKVMILNDGHIVEFDRPSALLNDKTSSFYSLCKATGESEFNALKKMIGM